MAGPSPRRKAATLVLLSWVAALAAVPAAAQQRGSAIQGVVVNRQTGGPVDGALVRLTWTSKSAIADSAGRFELSGLAPGIGLLQVRAIGYRVGSWPIRLSVDQALSDTFELDPAPVELAEVLVPGRPRDDWRSAEGFEARRQKGGGYFITEDQIQRQRPNTLVEILRTVPGVMTSCTYFGCGVRMSRSPRPCSPEYFLDGYPATFATGPDFPIQAIRGVEIYPDAFSTPIEFQRLSLRCGVIAIWTRMER